ncbi:MAG: exonuclease domain-containing protein [bacterium]|nr:exonuclease domain-containing protein [bacterium]
MISDSQIFIVVDIEADGPAVGLNSMLSLAAVATTTNEELSHFYHKLITIPDASPDPVVTEWWSKYPEAHREATADPEPPEHVMTEFYTWITNLGREAIFVSNPISLDYTFVSWYLFRFAPGNPFKNEKNSIRALDLKSYVAGKYGLPFEKAKRAYWPEEVTKNMPAHTHNALDDARGYAVVLRNLIAMGDKVDF